MYDADLDLDLELAEVKQQREELGIDGQYAGVAWGLAEADVVAAQPS
jgi:hypothetical protein